VYVELAERFCPLCYVDLSGSGEFLAERIVLSAKIPWATTETQESSLEKVTSISLGKV
jgi:hypothetical protein